MKTDYRMKCTYAHMYGYMLGRVITIYMAGNHAYNPEGDYRVEQQSRGLILSFLSVSFSQMSMYYIYKV